MRNYYIKTMLYMLILYMFVAVFIFSFFAFYSNNFTDTQAKKYGEQIHNVVRNKLNISLEQDYTQFLNYITQYQTIEVLNNNLDLIKVGSQQMIKFYTITETGIIIDNQVVDFSSSSFNHTYDLSISFYSFKEVLEGINNNVLYGVFRYGNIIGVFDALAYLSAYQPENSLNTIIIRSNGIILASHIKTNAKLLSEYINTSTTILVNEFFANKQRGIQWVEIENQTYGMAYGPLTNDIPLYFLSFLPRRSLVDDFSELHLFFIAAISSVGLIFIISNIIIFYTTHLKFTEVENSRIRVYYNQRIMMRINSSGKILGFNKIFKKILSNYKNYKHISDFGTEEISTKQDLVENVKRLLPFNIILKTDAANQNVRLTPLKMGLNYLLIGENLTENSDNLRDYESLALVNRVTNLPNYNYFMQFLNDEIKKNVFNSGNYVIIGINIIDFKFINKLIGEDQANQVLRDFSDMIQKSLSDTEYKIFNTYVDNFVIVFKNSLSVEAVEKWFEEFLINVEAKSERLTSNLNLQLCAGIYDVKQVISEGTTAKHINNRIITALKYAKTSSNLKYARFDQKLQNAVSNQKRIESGLIESVRNNEFEMYLQPQYDIKLERIVSFESLIRWKNPKFENVKTSEFIRLAEESNLIVQLGMFAIEETIKLSKKLEKYNVKIAMNVSPIQMIQKGFVSLIEELISKYEVLPGKLAIEITETTVINSLQIISEKLKSLQKIGIDIHLDDFGMGYSSLLYLKNLPINTIKIDKGFVDYITTDKYSKAIANMVVSLSKNIGAQVIAEGVETKAQLNILKKIGVNIIQGFYISKAVPYDKVVEMLEEINKK